MTIKQKLEIIRRMLGLTQAKLAERFGVSFATFNSWWNGKSVPRQKMQAMIDELFLEVIGQKIIPADVLTAKKQGVKNVEFLLGEIENLPIADNSVDTIITNCVINLTPDKAKTFSEAYRVLKPAGKIYLSDIVLLHELTEEQRNNKELISGCVAGALLRDDYLNKIKQAGFSVKVLYENTGISKQQYNGMPLESIMVELTK